MAITTQKLDSSRTLVMDGSKAVALIEGSPEVYVCLAKDDSLPVSPWSNAVPVARWKYGKMRRSRATAWAKAMLSRMDSTSLKQRLALTTPAGLAAEFGLSF